MIIKCPFLIKYKDFEYIYTSGTIFKCTVGNVLLKSGDLKERWACKGCQIPRIVKKISCSYLKPHKIFLIRGSSKTWLSCELLNMEMDSSGNFCQLNCKLYE